MKKAEGTLSSVYLMLLVGLGVMMIIGLIIFKMSSSFGVTNVPEFESYNSIYNEFNSNISNDLMNSQNNVNDNTTTKGFMASIPVVGGFLDSTVNSVFEWWDNSLLKRGYSSVKIFFKTGYYVTKSVNTGIDNTKIIPPITKWIIGTLLGSLIIILIIRATWEKRSS